jgi:type VI secretion system secreted protein VgrG
MAHENLHLKVEIEIAGAQKISIVSSLEISQTMEWHHTFEFKTALESIEGERAINLNSSQNLIGKEIKIALISQDGGEQLNFFKGIVTNVSLSRFGGNAADIVVSGHGSSILLDDGPSCSSYLEKPLKQVVQTVTGPYPKNLLSIKNSPSQDPMLPFVAQYNESTYHFLGRLASVYGQWFYYNGTELIFGSQLSGPAIELNFGHDLESFDLSMKVMPLNFETNSYDYVQQKALKKASSQSVQGQSALGQKAVDLSKSLFSAKHIVHNKELVADDKELNDILTNRLGARGGDLVHLNGKSDNPRLKVGSKIKITGAMSASMGSEKTDYGQFIVTGVTHQTDGLGKYKNHFTAIPSDLKIPPLNPNFRSITIDTQAAKVVDNKDPDKMGRIKVRMYWQKDSDTTGWIRYMAHHSGKSRGFYFIPEIDDEVIVAFENGNLNMPFVIGSVYNGKANSSDRAETDNLFKSIRTISGNEIYFSDKSGEETIHVYTKDKKNEILISMKDDGIIKIKSNKNIAIEAPENIEVKSKNMKFEAQEKIEFKAKEFKVGAQTLIQMDSMKDFKQKGLDVTVEATKGYVMKANATAKLSANATMEVSSSAKTSVKAGAQLEMNGGANAMLKAGIVMIN